MIGMAVKAAIIISDPSRLGFLALGVMLGLVIGVIPGLGGLVGLSLLLPFTFSMDPFAALALMLGLASVTVTSDTIPAVLFGVPGTVGSAATILDGHPLAKQGQAGRAFGAAFSASVMGGLIGAAILAVSVPILRPVMLFIGTPELLAICILGLSLVATLSGGSPMKGLAAACIGLLVATIGEEPQSGEERWVFDTLYLIEGLPIVPVALGIFALPELADMAISRTPIAQNSSKGGSGGQLEGVKDVLKNWFLVLRCSAIGSTLGAIPGIGASVIDWIAYGHAARTEKGAQETFGKGDIRGVIASESANNAKEGGALIPTIAFGVPGSASMTLLLGAFLIHGITPGPKMLTEQLDVTYVMVWSVAIANILGAGLCFAFANQLAKVALIRSGILVPVVLAITFVGAFQGSRSWGDLYILLAFGVLGWIMKQKGWPRPPLILGFVLGGLVENYMFISVGRYGIDWLGRPVVLVILALTLLGIFRPLLKKYAAKRRAAGSEARARPTLGLNRANLNSDALFGGLVLLLFAASIYFSQSWDFGAKLVPWTVGIAGLIFVGSFLFLRLFVISPAGGATPDAAGLTLDLSTDYGGLSSAEILQRAALYFGWCFVYLGMALIVGLLPALFLFLAGYLRITSRETWVKTLTISASVWVFSYVLFHVFLLVPWPETVIGHLFPGLRSIRPLALF
ncbi:MAG: tripartite tricarboxylate transporter permease [Alphaproteobacteria bacterium]|nr:tripartite tricarboxylate transporter permease [Alphaproteobacteria bacterium]